MLDSWLYEHATVDLSELFQKEPIKTKALSMVRDRENFRQAGESMMSRGSKDLARRLLKAQSQHEQKEAIDDLRRACNLGTRLILI